MSRIALSYSQTGQGAPLVLIHGVGSRAEDWSGVIDALGEGFSILAYDQRGHGDSDTPPGPYTIEHLTGDLINLMDDLGLARAHIAGFSLGGLVALSVALNHPERVDKLALISTVAGRTDEEKARVLARLEFLLNAPPSDYFEQSVERWFTPAFREAHPEVVAGRKARAVAMDPVAYAAAYHTLAHTDFGRALTGIEAETLVMTGEDDIGSTPRMAEVMRGHIPNAQLRILPGLRHSLLLEAPGVVGVLLRAFFRGEPLP
ncbi:MAG: alpha/beta fold hydrolase [Paracoccaceae bacterium]|nr:alpha/beta fold hydrolase [Paracoccaceae bacterium]